MTELAQLTRRLVAGTAHWSPAAWAARITPVAAPAPAASAEPGAVPTRADVLHSLVQQLADLSAEAESRPPQPVPRLANDLALPDQLWVVATDLVAAAPSPVLSTRAEAALRTTHHTLFP
ncbi:hypothetical protein [Actinocatenispora comari]|uniref:Uncharacterized protein n=1 Tax=Actinocatenispora comari TaxID=2807577 RepID=A0A8J4AI48_9ACTN|nr:hypothetical protein NUM_49710 [Actinocatenispora comari]